jgi:DNA-binding HxlR family transcriptional regulator
VFVPPTTRTYGDGCPAAHALDLVGERWALLLVRDLLAGPKRFTDLRAGLPQASPNVVTQRLRDLEAAGVLARRHLPPPASASEYELTERGAALEPVLAALRRWGAASPDRPRDRPVGAGAAVLALRTAGVAAAPELRATVELRLGREAFAVTAAGGALRVARGGAQDPDATLTTDPASLVAAVEGAEPAGSLRIDGDAEAARALLAAVERSAAAGGE